MPARLPLAALFVALLPCVAVAQEIPWQAERVMLRRDGVRAGRPVAGHLVRQGKELPADGPYTVLRADGGLLELGDNCGWVARADVVRMLDAVSYFTARIQEEPTAAKWYGRRAAAKAGGEVRTDVTSTPGQPRAVSGRPSDALDDLRAAVRLAPDETGWRHSLLAVYTALGDLDRAAEECETILRLAPNGAGGYSARAILRLAKKDHVGAAADMERAAELDPLSFATTAGLAAIYHSAGRKDKAEAALRRAVEMAVSDANSHYRRGALRGLSGDVDGLLADLSEAVRLNPAEVEYRLARGRVLRLRGEYVRALADIRTAARLRPMDPKPAMMEAFLLATCKEDALRDGQRAVILAEKAARMCGDSPGTNELLTAAAASAEVGDFPGAVAAQKRAIKALEKESTYYDEISGFRWWLNQYERDQPRRE